MNVFLVTLSILFVPLAFAGGASADWSCDEPTGMIDSCGGDTNEDNPFAACNGTWRDVFFSGGYAQVCVGTGDGAHAWACPGSTSYSTRDPTCRHVGA